MRRSVIDAPIPAMIHAEDGEVQAISSVWAEYLGYSHEELPTIMDWIETLSLQASARRSSRD